MENGHVRRGENLFLFYFLSREIICLFGGLDKWNSRVGIENVWHVIVERRKMFIFNRKSISINYARLMTIISFSFHCCYLCCLLFAPHNFDSSSSLFRKHKISTLSWHMKILKLLAIGSCLAHFFVVLKIIDANRHLFFDRRKKILIKIPYCSHSNKDKN